MGLRYSLAVGIYLNSYFLRISGPLKTIYILQCYVVLWTHIIDAIRTYDKKISYESAFRDNCQNPFDHQNHFKLRIRW